MKYIIYKEVPLVTGEKHRVYVQGEKQFTTQRERAKVIDVKSILELLLIVLQFILKYKSNLKYERYEN